MLYVYICVKSLKCHALQTLKQSNALHHLVPVCAICYICVKSLKKQASHTLKQPAGLHHQVQVCDMR